MKLLIFGISLTAMSFVSVANSDTTQLTQLMEKWLSIEQQKGLLQRQWNTKEQQLKQKEKLLSIEKKALLERVNQVKEANSEVDEKRLALTTEQTRLEHEQAVISVKLQQAHDALNSLLPQLPPPLQLQWREKMLLLTQSSASDSEKLERILSLFKLATEFDQRVAINRTSMKLEHDQEIFVTQIYLGLSQGWYMSDDGQTVGYGRSEKLGWQWFDKERAEAELNLSLDASALLAVRHVIENPTQAQYLSLPVSLSQ